VFFSCRFGTVMFLTLVLLKIKGVKTGFPKGRINLGFLGVVHNLYMEQINTWIIFPRLLLYALVLFYGQCWCVSFYD